MGFIDGGLGRSGAPEVNIDVGGVVSQFLSELSLFDLIVEMVQNDLDASATRTEIDFGESNLVCSGNGRAIDEKGWDRLRFVLGAGTQVIPKQGGIGSKNHGLRSAFLLGDQIVIQSRGQRIDLTVRGDLRDRRAFYPAVWPRISDSAAPRTGVRITIPYRTEALSIPERNPLEPIDNGLLSQLFEDAVVEAADRFLCASAPGRSWSYELVLSFGRRRISFAFECRPAPGRKGYWLRTCRQALSGRAGRVTARRLCAPFDLALDVNDHAKVPRLYRRGDKVLGELSWRVDRELSPVQGSGGYRYPIAYPVAHISNGWGFDVSGPFISGRARHSVSDDGRNALIIQAGRSAFLHLAKDLVSTHGPAALALTTNSVRADVKAEDDLVHDLAEAGTVAVLAGRKAGFALAGSARPILLATPSYAEGAISSDLATLATASGQTVHPYTPKSFVESLLRLVAKGRTAITIFTELDAAEAVFVTHQPPDKTGFGVWLDQCATALRLLEIARLQGVLKPDFLRELRNRASLPTSDEISGKWNSVVRSFGPPPIVPGVKPPTLLHASLAKNPIMKEGTGKVPMFKLDEYVSSRNFKPVAAEGRLRFFRWLRKGYRDLSSKCQAEIATYPIWPADDGSFHPLDYYCRPSKPSIQAMLAEVRAVPSEAVISFPGLRRSSRSSLRLRRTVTEAELTDWHVARIASCDTLKEQGLVNDLRDLVTDTEQRLTMLRSEGFPIATIASDHKTLSLSGDLNPITTLHVVTEKVALCALLPEDLVAGRQASLYTALGAQVSPASAAILRAFRSAPDADALFYRLHAYRAAGGNLADLSQEKILLVAGVLHTPGTLSLPSSTDWWGRWKISLERTPDVPDHVSLLEAIGVVRPSLKEELSRTFFDWVTTQPQSVQREHRQQIIRHWAERKSGPSRWIDRYPEKPCIPVHDREGVFELWSRNKAVSARSLLFLPDFEEGIQAQILKANARMRLTVVNAKGVDGSIMEVLRGVGVPSLRTYAARPDRLLSGALLSDTELDRELALVRSSNMLATLPESLQFHDVPSSSFRFGWRKLLQDLNGVRVTDRLTAVYSVLKREYELAVEDGVDAPSGQICVLAQSDRKMAFYGALAGYLFEIGSSKLYAYGLMRAVHSGTSARQFDELDAKWQGRSETEGTDQSGSPASEGQVGGGSVPAKGHGISEGESVPVVPSPEAFKPIIKPTYLKHGSPKSGKRRNSGRTDEKRNSVEEEDHIFNLKAKHYAWHCQACLGKRQVLELTPPRSYVYLPLHRRPLIEAHHVEHLQNDGLIGAQNILILCSYHHQSLGDALSRANIIIALENATPISREFPVDHDGKQVESNNGVLACLSIVGNSEKLSLFFTEEHAKAWRKLK